MGSKQVDYRASSPTWSGGVVSPSLPSASSITQVAVWTGTSNKIMFLNGVSVSSLSKSSSSSGATYNISFRIDTSAVNATSESITVGTLIKAQHLNNLSTTLKTASGMCLCHSNYCSCDCNYCSCDCNYCSCNCNYCSCNCNYCSCDCNYCSCDCNNCSCQGQCSCNSNRPSCSCNSNRTSSGSSCGCNSNRSSSSSSCGCNSNRSSSSSSCGNNQVYYNVNVNGVAMCMTNTNPSAALAIPTTGCHAVGATIYNPGTGFVHNYFHNCPLT